MIVRCKSCVSAFAVDDDKVANRKFAFTCPKCGTENIFDNRGPAVAVKTAEFDEFHEEGIFDEAPEEKAVAAGKTEERIPDDIFAEEHAPEPDIEDEFAAFDEEFTEKPVPAKPGRKLNLDIEEAAPEPGEKDFSISDEDILFGEAEAPAEKEKAKEAGEELFFDELEAEAAAEPAAQAELNEPDFISIDLDTELAGIEFEAPPEKKAAPADEFAVDIESDVFEDFGEGPGHEKSDRDKKLTSQNDIDALFAEASPLESAPARDEINIDLDSLDIEFEEKPAAKGVKEGAGEGARAQEELFFEEEPAAESMHKDEFTLDVDTSDLLQEPEQRKPAKAEAAEEDITIDIDSLDIEFEEPAEKPAEKKISGELEPVPGIEAMDFEIEEPETKVSTGKKPEEEELALDLDSLDIELEKPVSSGTEEEQLFNGEDVAIDIDTLDFETEIPAPEKPKVAAAKKEISDEDITLDIESLDIDIEEPVSESVKALPGKKVPVPETDESITLDMASLDIELEEPLLEERQPEEETFPEEEIEIDMESLDFEGLEEKPEPARKKNVREIVREQAVEGEEEDIKLNLDELDIDIDEIREKDLDFVKAGAKPAKAKKGIIEEAPEDEDESITIDLDTLDIEVAEAPSVTVEAELSEEDEKLTLDDAGMTFDELTAGEKPAKKRGIDLAEDEEIKLTLDEVDPEMRLEQIGEVASPDEPLLREAMEELPEISLDEFETAEVEPVEVQVRAKREAEREYGADEDIIFPEEELEIDLEPVEVAAGMPSRYSDETAPESFAESVYPSRGNTSFSIDFSLKYSRLGAFLRLLQLYTISMIPHFVLIFIYTMLSGILGFINQIVILSTGRCVEDFSQITENTLRYYLYIQTCVMGIVEDRPVYAGREKIDHQMQLNLRYPLKYSKVLAVFRLSVIGIFLITLPHIIMMLFITLLVPVVYLVGILAVIITGRWPNPLFMFLTMYFRYMARISAFMTGITDEYPPFRFE